MIVYDKIKIRESLTSNDIFNLLEEFGGEPEWTAFGIICSTICHNKPREGSRKLYYYNNTDLFKCYTGCDSFFDLFELTIKVAKIQWNKDFDLNDAVRFIATKFGISGERTNLQDELEDWKYLANYERIQEIQIKTNNIVLKEYDKNILNNFNYNLKITPWISEGISEKVLSEAKIGFYPGADQITIPHFDKDNRFIGLRGRSLCEDECQRYGKYRPIRVNQTLYTHPLGMNLYNLNNSQNNIKLFKKALVFEGEKSTLKYRTFFGSEADISTACCGSNLTSYQIELLIEAGAQEIIVGFDRQFKKIGDEEFKHLKSNLIRLRNKYKNYVNVSFIFDKGMITNYKSSPVDEGKEKFLQLFKDRIIL